MTDEQRIGVLVVHGMGEQRPTESRDEVADCLIRSWQRQYGESNVVDESPDHCVSIRIAPCNNLTVPVRVEVREVYWADLDENPTKSSQRIEGRIWFWWWSLTLWAKRRYVAEPNGSPGANLMTEPGPPAGRRLEVRSACVCVKLFGAAIWFLLLGATWELLRFVVRWLRIAIPGSGILVRYLGDVERYTENRYRHRPDCAILTDRPRDAIRRRMIAGLADMAIQGYDRWYIIAHSLGSVVAHNGLMELKEALPNYLDEKEWVKYRDRFGGANDAQQLIPRRPPRHSWVRANAYLDRRRLFKNLRGLLTYGSPLDKFATVWPAIVPINKDHEPLAGRKWINVYDRMDPIAGKLDMFDESRFAPQNVHYQSSRWFLLAHVAYLKQRKHSEVLADRIADWIVTDKFNKAETGRFDRGAYRKFWRYFFWFLTGFTALFLLTYVVYLLFGDDATIPDLCGSTTGPIPSNGGASECLSELVAEFRKMIANVLLRMPISIAVAATVVLAAGGVSRWRWSKRQG